MEVGYAGEGCDEIVVGYWAVVDSDDVVAWELMSG